MVESRHFHVQNSMKQPSSDQPGRCLLNWHTMSCHTPTHQALSNKLCPRGKHVASLQKGKPHLSPVTTNNPSGISIRFDSSSTTTTNTAPHPSTLLTKGHFEAALLSSHSIRLVRIILVLVSVPIPIRFPPSSIMTLPTHNAKSKHHIKRLIGGVSVSLRNASLTPCL